MTGSSPAVRAAAFATGCIAAAGAFAALGIWQLGRAADHRAVAAAYGAAAEAAPLTDVAAAAASVGALRYRRLAVDGAYDASVQVLLDNITRDGVAGYYVLTPFEPAGVGPRVLVNRGWIEADPDRRVVPRLDVEGRVGSVSGRIDRLPAPALALDAAPERLGDGLYRLSFPTPAELERLLGVELAPFQLLLDPDEPGGFERRWRPDTARADRNTAYAGQWFIMAVAAAGLAAWGGARAYRERTDETAP